MRSHRFPVVASLVPLLALCALPVLAQEGGTGEPKEQYFTPPPSESLLDKIRLGGWINLNYRNSEDHRFRSNYPFPVPVYLTPPDPGSSFEISDVTLVLDLAISESVVGKVKIDFIDLYDRNPTSSDDKIDVDEAWVRFGPKYESRIMPDGTTFYALLGKAPKFEKQIVRNLESYGLVSTAFNRMEDLQLQIGGSVGRNVYWRAQVSNGNPLYMRDPNLIAGDAGVTDTISEYPGFGYGYPILYDAEVEAYDANEGKYELGGGLGCRFGSSDGTTGIDLLGYYYDRELADQAHLTGSVYGGDLDILSAGEYSIPTKGRDKREAGGNLDARWGGLRFFVQYVDQKFAGLGRTGLEAEVAWKFGLPTLLTLDGNPVLTSIAPVVRYSELDNDFAGPREFPAPTFWWDWKKIDLGIRIGLIRNIDLTLEASRNDVDAKAPFKYWEGLGTLHVGF
jgi:hypothetical protein